MSASAISSVYAGPAAAGPEHPPALRHVVPDPTYRAGDAPEDRLRDLAIIAWIAHHTYVTNQQVLRRFFLSAGQSRQNAYRVLDRLDHAGILRRGRLNRSLGATSPHVVHLTGYGYALVGTDWPSWVPRPQVELRNRLLQMTEIALVRQPEGWVRIRRQDQRAILRAISSWLVAGLGAVHGDPSRVAKRDVLRGIADLTSESVSTDLLVHPLSKAVRFLLPVAAGTSYKRLIQGIYRVEEYGELPLEILCHDPRLWQRAQDGVPRIVKRELGLDAEVHRVLPFHTPRLVRGGTEASMPPDDKRRQWSPLDLPVFG